MLSGANAFEIGDSQEERKREPGPNKAQNTTMWHCYIVSTTCNRINSPETGLQIAGSGWIRAAGGWSPSRTAAIFWAISLRGRICCPGEGRSKTAGIGCTTSGRSLWRRQRRM